MAEIYNDGTVVHASRSITFSTAGALVCENIAINRGSRIVEQLGATGEPLKQVAVPIFVVGSGTAQIVTSGTLPLPGETFSATFHTTTGAENFFVSATGQPESQTDIKKVTFEFRKRYN